MALPMTCVSDRFAVRVAALLPALLLGVAGCGGGDDTGEPAPQTVEDTSSANRTPSTVSSRTDLEIARGAVLEGPDVPPGWVECCPPITFDDDSLRSHICGSPDDLPPRTAGYQRQFSLNLRPDGNEDGHLISAILVSATEEAATEEFAGVDAPDYEPCMIDSVKRTVATYRPDRTGETTTTFERAALTLDAPATLDRFVSTVPVGSLTGTLYTAIVRLQVGRVIARIEVDTFAAPAPLELLEEVATTSVGRIRTSLDGT